MRRIVIGLLVTGLMFLAPVPAQARPDFDRQRADLTKECPPDMPGCTRTPRQHRAHFRDGDYGRAKRHISYPRIAKRKILRRAKVVYHRRGLDDEIRWNRRRVWRSMKRYDNCVFTGSGPANTWSCSTERFAQEPANWRKWRGRVGFCGTVLVVQLWTGPVGWVTIGGGQLLCYWQFEVR